MFYHLIKNPLPVVIVPFRNSYTKLSPKSVDNAGVVVRSSIFEESSTKESLNSFDFNDFQISNLIAIGATDVLKETYMSDTNSFDVIENVANSLKSLNHE